MKVLNAAQMQAADVHAIEVLKIPSLVLMENAATHVSRILVENYSEPRAVAVVCGKGNNGGDGMAVARQLKQQAWRPVIILLEPSAGLKKDPAENWMRALNSGVRCLDNVSIADLGSLLSECDVIVDALFGTGLSKPLDGIYAQAVEAINSSGKDVWSIDVPSGLNSDSGEIIGRVVQATGTVALASLKYCHVLSPACEMCGRIYAVDIGIPAASNTSVIRSSDVAQLFPFRKPDSHKGTFGHVVVVGGSQGKGGAAFMTAKAALRSGAGLVTVFAPAGAQKVIASLGPEIMTHPAPFDQNILSEEAAEVAILLLADKSVAAIGPGIGTEATTALFLRNLLQHASLPMVIDADALNLVARAPEILINRKAGTTVLTPHPGEMARLLKTDIATIQKDRIRAAVQFAAETKSIVVLKGFRTIIADPDGHVWINPTGGQALSTGGTGDILTGAIAGFIAQNVPPLQAAIAAVYTHGFTGNLFEKEFPQQSLNAMDIPAYWNRAVHLIRTNKNVESDYLQFHFAF